MNEFDWDKAEEIRQHNTERLRLPCLGCGRMMLTTRTHRFCAACSELVNRFPPREINFTDLKQDIAKLSTEQARTLVG